MISRAAFAFVGAEAEHPGGVRGYEWRSVGPHGAGYYPLPTAAPVSADLQDARREAALRMERERVEREKVLRRVHSIERRTGGAGGSHKFRLEGLNGASAEGRPADGPLTARF